MATLSSPPSPPRTSSEIMAEEFNSMERRNFVLKNTQRKHSMRRRLLNQATYFSILDHTLYSNTGSQTSSGSSSAPSSPTLSPRRKSLPRSAPGSPKTSPPPSPASDPGSYTLTRRKQSIRVVECRRCSEKFDTPGAYKQHVASSGNHHVCNVCGQDYPTSDHLGVHVRRSHWMCSLCPRLHPEGTNLPYFASKSQLETHFLDEHKEQYCELCSCCFVSSEKKKEHVQEAHWACPDCTSGEKMPRCEEFDDSDEEDSDDEDDFMMMEDDDAFFKTREELEDHMFERHGEFYCGYCKEALPSKSAQIKHMATSHPHPAEPAVETSQSVADQTTTTATPTTTTPTPTTVPTIKSPTPRPQFRVPQYTARSSSPLSPYSRPYAPQSPRSPLPPVSSPSHARRSSITSIAEDGPSSLRNNSITPPPMNLQPPMKRQRSNTNAHSAVANATVKCC